MRGMKPQCGSAVVSGREREHVVAENASRHQRQFRAKRALSSLLDTWKTNQLVANFNRRRVQAEMVVVILQIPGDQNVLQVAECIIGTCAPCIAPVARSLAPELLPGPAVTPTGDARNRRWVR